MFKKIANALIDHPFISSIVLSDLFILLFHKPPLLFAIVMFGILIGFSMFLGQKLSLFKQ